MRLLGSLIRVIGGLLAIAGVLVGAFHIPARFTVSGSPAFTVALILVTFGLLMIGIGYGTISQD